MLHLAKTESILIQSMWKNPQRVPEHMQLSVPLIRHEVISLQVYHYFEFNYD